MNYSIIIMAAFLCRNPPRAGENGAKQCLIMAGIGKQHAQITYVVYTRFAFEGSVRGDNYKTEALISRWIAY